MSVDIKLEPAERKAQRPAISKDGKQQMCFRCGKYVSRARNTCPRCDRR